MASFNYIVFVTGDCQNNGSGSIQVGFSGGTPPYTVQWQPPLGYSNYLAYNYDYLDPLSINLTYAFANGLSAGTYAFRVNDSTMPVNLEFDVNVPVSSGNCATIIDVSATTCSQSNGSVTVQDSSNFSEINYYGTNRCTTMDLHLE